MKSPSRSRWEEPAGVETAVLAEILAPELPWDGATPRTGTQVPPPGLGHRAHPVNGISGPFAGCQTWILTGFCVRSHSCLASRSTSQKHSGGVGVRGRTQGLCQTRGDNNSGAPCPALSLHLAYFDPKENNHDPLELPLTPPKPPWVLCCVPSIPDRRIPTFQSRGTEPMWHCPLLSVAAGTPPKATALSRNTEISVTRGIPEGPESHRAVPGRCCIHEPQA